MALIKVFRLPGPNGTAFVLAWQGGPRPSYLPEQVAAEGPVARGSGHIFALLRRANWGEPMALIKVFGLPGPNGTAFVLAWQGGPRPSYLPEQAAPG